MPRRSIHLCYHKVAPIAREGRWLNVEPGRLRSHVRHFARRGWGFRTARDAERSEDGTVAFHFDDAYASALESAPPIFADHGVAATFWVVPSAVGVASVWDGDRAAPLAGWDALERARDLGHEIGNHTRTHPRLSTLDREEQRREFSSTRDELLRRGFPNDSVCFPYGDYDAATLEAMAGLSLSVGFALKPRNVPSPEGVRVVPRIVVSASDGLPGLLYKIHLRPLLP